MADSQGTKEVNVLMRERCRDVREFSYPASCETICDSTCTEVSWCEQATCTEWFSHFVKCVDSFPTPLQAVFCRSNEDWGRRIERELLESGRSSDVMEVDEEAVPEQKRKGGQFLVFFFFFLLRRSKRGHTS